MLEYRILSGILGLEKWSQKLKTEITQWCPEIIHCTNRRVKDKRPSGTTCRETIKRIHRNNTWIRDIDKEYRKRNPVEMLRELQHLHFPGMVQQAPDCLRAENSSLEFISRHKLIAAFLTAQQQTQLCTPEHKPGSNKSTSENITGKATSK